MVEGVKALVFDVFGSVVDWRTSLIADISAFAAERGVKGDWERLVDDWRAAYMPGMNEVRTGKLPWTHLDVLHRRSLDRLLAEQGIEGFDEAAKRHVNLGWHRLKPWPDSVEGLTRLKKKFVIAPLSNGTVALLTNMAKNGGLPWDCILATEIFKHYKPDPETYLGAASILQLQPHEVMMCAAHNGDLAHAKKNGLRTAFWPRPTEYGPRQKVDFEATEQFDIVAKDIVDLARQLGC